MVCKLAKKAMLGAALAAGGTYLVFGTAAPNYVRTAFHKARETAKGATPIQFEIEVARDQIAQLEPEIHKNMETLARAEVDVEHLNREIETVRNNLKGEREKMVSLRGKIETGDLRLASNSNVRLTVEEAKADLAGRMDHYTFTSDLLKQKEETLKARQTAVEAARLKLQQMNTQKRALAAQVEKIQARLQSIEATEQKNEFHFDDNALARAKATVADLEKRLEVKTRLAEMEGHYSGGVAPAVLEGDRDVIKEFDSKFGPGEESKPSGDKKSL